MRGEPSSPVSEPPLAKLRASRLRMRRETGRCEGRKPYGEKPQEQTTVSDIVSLRQQGFSLVKIAEKLNADGIKPRSGAKWHPTQVQRIVKRAQPKPKSRRGR